MPIPWYNTHITQGFFWANVPSSSRGAHGTVNGHSGIDLSEENGTPVTSPVTGTVLHAGAHKWGGQVDILWSALNQSFVVSFLHLSDIYVSEGQRVGTGQLIGLTGGASWSKPIPTLCCSSGPHLHFELTKGDKAPYADYSPQRPLSGNYPLDPTDFWTQIKNNGLANDQSALAGSVMSGPNAGKHGGLAVVGTSVSDPSQGDPNNGGNMAHQALVEVPGFAGIVLAFDRAEQFTPYNPPQSINPFAGIGYGAQWMHDNATAMAVRGMLVVAGIIIVLLVITALLRKPAVAGLQTAAQLAPLAAL